jgi:hypothetical protein
LYFKPKNAEDAVSNIIELVGNQALKNELIEKGKKQLGQFDNAKERARKYLTLCKQYLHPLNN